MGGYKLSLHAPATRHSRHCRRYSHHENHRQWCQPVRAYACLVSVGAGSIGGPPSAPDSIGSGQHRLATIGSGQHRLRTASARQHRRRQHRRPHRPGFSHCRILTKAQFCAASRCLRMYPRIGTPLMVTLPPGLRPHPSRLLKNSAAFATEARKVVAIVYVEVAGETARSANHSPSATAGGVILVVPLP